MNEDPRSRWEDEDRRNVRIRELRAQRGAVDRRQRRPFQPLILLAWFAGVAALAAVLIFIGFLAFAPRMMSWVEANPGMIKQGIVLDFVRWYQPHALDDVPASADGGRINIEVPTGATDAEIGHLLFEKGLVRSELAFQYWVAQVGRAGSLQAGSYDLSPSLTPSEIAAALQQKAGVEVTIRIQEGWRLEQIVAYLSTTKLTMNLNDFVTLVKTPPGGPAQRVRLLPGPPHRAQPGGIPLPRYIPHQRERHGARGGREAARHVRRPAHVRSPGRHRDAEDRRQAHDRRPGGHPGEHCRARSGARLGATDDCRGLHESSEHGGLGAERGPDAPVRTGHGGERGCHREHLGLDHLVAAPADGREATSSCPRIWRDTRPT